MIQNVLITLYLKNSIKNDNQQTVLERTTQFALISKSKSVLNSELKECFRSLARQSVTLLTTNLTFELNLLRC